MPSSGFVFTGQSGCLLPMLIILNLFFGKFIFNSNSLWLGVEGVLILLFIIKIHIFARKISEQLWPKNRKPRSKIVDIQGQVVEEDNSTESLT
jgi:hypothetical protein